SATAPTAVGSYDVVATVNDPNYQGEATGVLNISKAAANVTLSQLQATYDGLPKSAGAATDPAGLAVSLTYDGAATAPTAAGSYDVLATVNDPNYQGEAAGVLTISKAAASVTLSQLQATYDGSPKPAGAATDPAGLAVSLTYDGSATAPTDAGSYDVVATVTDPNYQGEATGVLNISPVSASVSLSQLQATYDGSPKPAVVTTEPEGLAVGVTYDGAATSPTEAGSYAVSASVTDPNYSGSAADTLIIEKAAPTITFEPADEFFYGEPREVILSAASDSSGAIAFALVSGPAAMSGDTLTLTGPGSVTIRADVEGDANYNPGSLTQSLEVTAHADAQWSVTNCNDSGEGSLRRAIAQAVDGNVIGFDTAIGCREVVLQSTLELNKHLTIDGKVGEEAMVLSGGDTVRVLSISGVDGSDGRRLTLRNLDIAHGYTAESGAGLLNDGTGSALVLESVTLRGNMAVGDGAAMFNQAATPSLTNVTFSGNRAGGMGGALADVSGGASLEHVTVAGNEAESWGGIYGDGGTIAVQNSVFWDNGGDSLGGTAAFTVSDSVVEGGFESGSGIIAEAPRLASLDNWGGVPTHALLPGSSAIGLGDPTVCAVADARGTARDSDCDAGAFQSRGFTAAVAGGDGQSAALQSQFTEPLTVTVTSTHGEPVAGGAVTFSGPESGAGISGSPATATIEEDGTVVLAATANGDSGSYAVEAASPGMSSVSFQLENLLVAASISVDAPVAALVGETISLTSTVTSDAGIPEGSVAFEFWSGEQWEPAADVPLADGSASHQVSGALPVGTYRWRTRYGGSATHSASGWGEVAVSVYEPLVVDDGASGGDPLSAGESRFYAVSGAGGDFGATIMAPGGQIETLPIEEDGFTFTPAEEGAFAGSYRLTITDSVSGFSEVLWIDVPLAVMTERATLLSMDERRNLTSVEVRGAPPGETITLELDAEAAGRGVTVTTEVDGIAQNESSVDNPARFTVAVPDAWSESGEVVLSAQGGGLPAGSARLDVQVPTVHVGRVHNLSSEWLAGAEVALLSAEGEADPQPLKDGEGEPFTALTDEEGRFRLYAPPLGDGEAHTLRVRADGYAATSRLAGDCTEPAPCLVALNSETAVAEPTLNPPAGEFEGAVDVTIQTETADAVIRYTLDGSEPGPYSGLELPNGDSLRIVESATLRAVALKKGVATSSVVEGRYSIMATPPATSGGGGSSGWGGLVVILLLLAQAVIRPLLPGDKKKGYS
ncbi:MAG: MBG domain-containing protein, partial [Pseudomonadota bacterium]